MFRSCRAFDDVDKLCSLREARPEGAVGPREPYRESLNTSNRT